MFKGQTKTQMDPLQFPLLHGAKGIRLWLPESETLSNTQRHTCHTLDFLLPRLFSVELDRSFKRLKKKQKFDFR